MKKTAKLYILTVFLFALLFLSANLVFARIIRVEENNSYVLMNRVFEEIRTGVSEGNVDAIDPDAVSSVIDDVYYAQISELKKEFGKNCIPERVYFIPVNSDESEVNLINPDKDYEKIWALQTDGRIYGFVVFEYTQSSYSKLRLLTFLCIARADILYIAWPYKSFIVVK